MVARKRCSRRKVLDAFYRREIGWALERNLEDTLTLGALRMAIERRRPTPGLVFCVTPFKNVVPRKE